jgi:hypothetical protein
MAHFRPATRSSCVTGVPASAAALEHVAIDVDERSWSPYRVDAVAPLIQSAVDEAG